MAALALAGEAAAAEPAGELYQAQTIVTGQVPENRPLGFAQCFEDVLVKVSGDPRLIGDPRVAAMAAGAASFVGEFRYHDRMSGIPHHDEQGSRDRPYDLIVRFRAAQIDAALRSLGREPWAGPRPRVVVFLGMRKGTKAYMVAADGDREPEREALAAAAARRGMPMALPSGSALAEAGLSFANVAEADLARLDSAARALGGDVALVGRMDWREEDVGWLAEWRLRSQGEAHRWRLRSESFDAGFRAAMGGAAQVFSSKGRPN